MTISGWILFGVLALCVGGLTALICCEIDSKSGIALTIVVAAILIFGMLFGFRWYYQSTASGQRALKTQESNLGGGLYRTVEVYSYDGDLIKSWSGEFDVTENDQETFFDIDGRRVIIQGGIIINEEVGEK